MSYVSKMRYWSLPLFADASAVCTAICFTVYVWSRWMIQFLKSTQESKAKENNENKPRERWVEEFENPVNSSQHASPIIELCVTNYHLACKNLYHRPQWFIRELTWDKYALYRDVNWNGLEDLPVAIRSANTDCPLRGVNF